jgi:hypothetical protein
MDHMDPSLLLTGNDTLAGFPRMRARVTVIMGNLVITCRRLVWLDGQSGKTAVAGVAFSFFGKTPIGEHF